MSERKRFLHIILLPMLTWCFAVPCHADSVGEHIKDMKIDDANSVITLCMDETFGRQQLGKKAIRKIYRKAKKSIRKALPEPYVYYELKITVGGKPIESMAETREPQQQEKHPATGKLGGWWGDVEYDGPAWVTNVSHPFCITGALSGRHISLWQSHGRYYDSAKALWKWQRPFLFSTTEDLFTQTIVVPYLIPMLENAGACVFTPRERDWQSEEVIVDNDDHGNSYVETDVSGHWVTADSAGFAMPVDTISDGYNPFMHGTVRKVAATGNENCSYAVYQPVMRKAGRYAVYVSYSTEEKSVDDALYSVYHRGQRTDFRVNQRMGGGTWVYLGTFDFGEGSSTDNCVIVYANSASKGVVTTDAVRFGGGMGNISRGGSTSGMPRSLEGARYYAQWAGAPYEVYGGYKGENDYKDDINARSLMTNWLSGGSVYNPGKAGKGVPFDLALAVHSDAGYNSDMTSIYGSLAICTTVHNDGLLASGLSRKNSRDLAERLLEQSKADLKARYGRWEWRDLYDRNYSEARLPAMPSAIFEALSHQNFPDMKLAHDPDFKFTLARSIYKTLLRYEAEAHGGKAIVQPLAPENFSVRINSQGMAELIWVAGIDKEEPTSVPAGYNVYMAMGDKGYDNGTHVVQNYHAISLLPDVLYRFRITAVNAGGESFPTEELCALFRGGDAPTVLVVNGFQRLSSPAVIETAGMKGFDLNADIGVSYGKTACWSGQQQNYDVSCAGHEGPDGFGYSGQELQGQFIAGNDFNYVTEHSKAIAEAGRYNIASAAKSVVEWGGIDLKAFDCLDMAMGNERNDGHSLKPYKTFSKQLRRVLAEYMENQTGSLSGRHTLLVSGSYVASDMQEGDEERRFLQEVLHTGFAGTLRGANSEVNGLQQSVALHNALNADHYAAVQTDVLQPADGAFVAMQYADGQPAAIALQRRLFVAGFPLECMKERGQMSLIMRGILAFLLK